MSLPNLKPRTRPDAIQLYPLHLRRFLAKRNRLGELNPSGITGFYGTETRRMTEAVYRYQATVTRDQGWLRGDLTTPGAKMLGVIGLRSV